MAQSPWVLAWQSAVRLAGLIRIRQIVGERDTMLMFNLDFHIRLNQLGIAHEFIVVDGVGHKAMKLFEAMGDENWDFYSRERKITCISR